MAKNQIKGINIEIGGNTAPLDKALGDVNAKTGKLQSELREVEKLLKLDPTNTELLSQKQKLLGDSIENTSDKLKALKDAEKQAQKQFEEGKISEEQYRGLQREIVKTEQELKKVEEQAKKSNAAMSSEQAIGNLKKIGVVAGGVALAIGGALVGSAVKAGQAADDINTLSKQTGIATDTIQKFQYASDRIDVSMETLTGSMSKLTKNMGAAQDGGKAATEAFEKLGVSFKDDVTGELRDNEDVFADAIQALSEMTNETERDAAAMALFGKSAQDLNPLILGGADALKTMGDEAEAAGLILSQDALDSANEFADSMDELKAVSSGIFQAVGTEVAQFLAPALQGLVDTFRGLPQWIEENKTLLTAIGLVVGTLTVAIIAYNISIAAASIATGIATAAATAFGAVMAFITSPITLVVLAIGALIAIGVLLYKNFDEIKEFAAKAWDAISRKVSEALTAAMNKLKEWGTNVLNWITKDVPGFIAKIVGFFAGLPGKLAEELKKALTAIGTWITDGVTKAKTEVPKIITAIKDAFLNLPKDMLKIGGNIVSGIWDGILGMAQWLKDKVAGFVSGIVSTITSAFTSGSSLHSGTTKDLKGYINGTHADGLSYVPFNGYRAELHKGEGVLTAEENRQYRSGGSSVNHTGTIRVEGVNNKGDLIAVSDIIMNQLRRELRTT